MKNLVFVAFLLIAATSFSQVKFKSHDLPNGLRYPVLDYSSNQAIQDSVNTVIEATIADLKESDFCVGDYGYVQKGNHVEVHIVCTCIDLPETEHRYLLFNMESGMKVDYPDLFKHKQKDTALKIINSEIRKKKATNACGADYGDMESDLSWDKLTIRLYKDGIEIRPAESACAKTPINIPWTALTECLKYNFI